MEGAERKPSPGRGMWGHGIIKQIPPYLISTLGIVIDKRIQLEIHSPNASV